MLISPFILKELPFFLYPIFFSDEMPVFSSCIVIFMVLLTAWLHLCKVAEGFLFTRGFFCHHVEPVGFCGLSGLWGQMLLWVGIWLALRFSMDITCSLGLGRKPVSTGHPGAGRQPLCRWFWKNLLLAFLFPAGCRFPGLGAETDSELCPWWTRIVLHVFARQFMYSFGLN